MADQQPARWDANGLRRTEAPLVPRSTIGGHALIAVIAIMTFLAALTAGAVVLVVGAASEWQSDVAREMTVQVRPAAGRDVEADVTRAVAIAKATPGIAEVRPYSRAESMRLLEPWLGGGLALDDLPIPRVIVLRLAGDHAFDAEVLRAALARDVATASLDDHRGWIDHMRAMATSAIAIGLTVLLLVLAATVLTVTFATRGAMAANRPIVEVLHFIGATDRYVAAQFQRHFLALGFKGGLIGGGGAVLVFLIAKLAGDWLVATASGNELSALFGSFSIGTLGYAGILVQIVLIAVVTAATSREVVNRTLKSI
ncbi:MAG TPA: ABC transporter permease [Xanthobacteraceae bacterium]|nr:ABC transporter permease [Xanthobacteraceae bacterium]